MKKIKGKRPGKGRLIQPPEDDSEPPDDSQRPKFCLAHMACGFSVVDCSKEQKAQFADKLRQMSSLSWAQLRHAPRHGQGYEIIARDSMLVPVPRVITEDVHIIAFRCWGIAPLLGFRIRAVFHIVWLDPNFRVYPH